jgi:hypothetical protein
MFVLKLAKKKYRKYSLSDRFLDLPKTFLLRSIKLVCLSFDLKNNTIIRDAGESIFMLNISRNPSESIRVTILFPSTASRFFYLHI